MTATSYTTDQLPAIKAFAAGLIQEAREGIDRGLGDDDCEELLTSYAYFDAPDFISVAEMRDMTEQARELALAEARAAGHPNVL